VRLNKNNLAQKRVTEKIRLKVSFKQR